MARIRTTPATLPAISKDLIVGFKTDINYSVGANPVFEGVSFSYLFRHVDENGAVVHEGSRTAAFQDLPVSMKSDLRSLYQRILVIAENQGDIGAGTDEGDDLNPAA